MIKEVIILLILLMPSVLAEDIQNSPRNINIEDTSSRLLEENYYSILESNIVAKVNNDVEYLHRDRLGSNIATTGNDLKRNKNLPFGQEISNDGITYSFTGKELDDNDLYYFVNRYYNPDSGRFLETDSVYSNPSYVYANNNPLLYVDPDGRDIISKNKLDSGDIFSEIEIFGKEIPGRKTKLIARFNVVAQNKEGLNMVHDTLSKIGKLRPSLIKPFSDSVISVGSGDYPIMTQKGLGGNYLFTIKDKESLVNEIVDANRNLKGYRRITAANNNFFVAKIKQDLGISLNMEEVEALNWREKWRRGWLENPSTRQNTNTLTKKFSSKLSSLGGHFKKIFSGKGLFLGAIFSATPEEAAEAIVGFGLIDQIDAPDWTANYQLGKPLPELGNFEIAQSDNTNVD